MAILGRDGFIILTLESNHPLQNKTIQFYSTDYDNFSITFSYVHFFKKHICTDVPNYLHWDIS